MPGFRKSAEEVQRIEACFHPVRLVLEELSVDFQTTWEYARWVLPPCFEPMGDEAANTACGAVLIERYQSACVGESQVTCLSLGCKYGDIEGSLLLVEFVFGEMPVTLGREALGFPKKAGTSEFFVDGEHAYGYSERKGIRVIEIEAEINGPELGPKTESTHGFDLKMFPHANGEGLQYPPLLNIWDVRNEYTSIREGTGSLKWGHSPWDPTDTIPLVTTGTARLSQYETCFPLGRQVELEDPDDVYKQYLWGRAYDDLTLYPVAARWQMCR